MSKQIRRLKGAQVIGIDELNQRLQDANRTYFITGVASTPNYMQCHCRKCGQDFQQKRYNILYATGCPVCKGRIVVKGYNDFGTKRPELIQYLANKEDAYKYSCNANHSVLTRCPSCKNERNMMVSNLCKRGFACPCFNKSFGHTVTNVNDIQTKAPWMLEYFVEPSKYKNCSPYSRLKAECRCTRCKNKAIKTISDLYTNGMACQYCGDGISFPNKFGRAVLSQLPVKNLKVEFSCSWSEDRRYDAYFEYDNKCYIIEFDGGFHYQDTNISKAENIKEVDRYKEYLALKHEIEVIRIDCKKSNSDYIKKSMEESKLNTIFDLSNIDWSKCETQALDSVIVQVCREYNADKMLVQEIAQKYQIHPGTARRYIKQGAKLGLCDISENPHIRSARIKKTRLIKEVG